MNKSIPKKEDLIRYYLSGYSMKEIGESLGFSTGKIHKYFHIYNIEPRKAGSDNEFARIKMSKSLKGRTSPRKNIRLSEEEKKNCL